MQEARTASDLFFLPEKDSDVILPTVPIIKSAIKKMRADVRRREHNYDAKKNLKEIIKYAYTKKTFANVSAAYSALDRAVKRHAIHPNFAARHKSQLSKLARPTKLETAAAAKKPATKAVAKTSSKPRSKKRAS